MADNGKALADAHAAIGAQKNAEHASGSWADKLRAGIDSIDKQPDAVIDTLASKLGNALGRK